MAVQINRQLHKIDANGEVLGRLAGQIALILAGKNKPEYLPHIDMGDIVEVTNADKVKLTGRKIDQKVYQHHSGHPGGLKTEKIAVVMVKKPGDVLKRAVREMLPDNKLRKARMQRLIIK